MRKCLFYACLILVLGACQSQKEAYQVDDSKEILFVGTYTRDEGHVDGKGAGVYVYEMNKETGALRYLSVSDSVVNPSYLAVHPNRKWLYAVNEFGGEASGQGSVSAFKFNLKDQSLVLQNQVASGGEYPCHLSIDNSGGHVMVANYVGGTVVALPINEDGTLEYYSSIQKHSGSSSHPRQEAPHAHQIVQHPTEDFVVAVDLGADRIYGYELDTAESELIYVDDYPNPPRMSGPRHLAFHPSKQLAYVLNELIGTIEVSLTSDSLRFIRSIQVISTQAPGDDRPASSAAIKVHPNGKFLYASNRGELNEIVVFAILEKGELELVGRQSTFGKTPRDFEIDPSGRFLLAANQDSGTIVTFAIDQESGLLSETGYVAEVPTPVCLKFLN